MSDDLDSAATKRDLADLRIGLTDRMQALQNEVSSLRNSFRLQIVVPSLTLLVSLLIHYFFR